MSTITIVHAQTATPQLEHAPVGGDPFNRVQAKDTAGFVWHLQRNAALRQRYARHFGIPEGEVIAFVKNALVLSTMQQDADMTTFGITKNGTIYPVKTRLPKGTKVWATREGIPVLKWNCSNPLEWKLPGQDLRQKPYAISVTPNPVVPPEQSIAMAVPESFDIPETANTTDRIVTTRLAVVPNEPIFPAPTATSSVLGQSNTNFGGGGGNFGGAIGLPLLLGGLSVLVPGGGGDVPVVTPVPEASTIALLSFGILASGVGIALRRRK